MKALTMWQPWAQLVSLGQKEYETRSWAPPETLRGQRIAIHAAKRRVDPHAISPIIRSILHDNYYEDWAGFLQYGEIIAVATVADWYECRALMPVSISKVEAALGDFSSGRYAWRLTDVYRLAAPITMRGYQRLWTVSDHYAAHLERVGEQSAS